MSIEPASHRIIVLIGVSGAGKSTIGAALAGRWGVDFVEGDDFHPAGNIARMAAGMPLDDSHRWPWLDALAAEIDRHHREARPAVVACSALRRRYRDRLRISGVPMRFVFLDPSSDELERRVTLREHEFMPPALLAAQLELLERPDDDENDVVEVTPGEEISITLDRIEQQLAKME